MGIARTHVQHPHVFVVPGLSTRLHGACCRCVSATSSAYLGELIQHTALSKAGALHQRHAQGNECKRILLIGPQHRRRYSWKSVCASPTYGAWDAGASPISSGSSWRGGERARICISSAMADETAAVKCFVPRLPYAFAMEEPIKPSASSGLFRILSSSSASVFSRRLPLRRAGSRTRPSTAPA